MEEITFVIRDLRFRAKFSRSHSSSTSSLKMHEPSGDGDYIMLLH